MHEEPARVDASQSRFYEWLDGAAIRELVHRSLELSAGERLMLIKGLVPGLTEVMGLADFYAFLAGVAIKARRFQEPIDHPGDGRASRVNPGRGSRRPDSGGSRSSRDYA